MATRRKNQGTGGLEFVVIGAFFFLVYVAPALLLLFWLVAEIRTRTSGYKNAAASITPSTDERDTLNKVASFRDYTDGEINRLFRKGQDAGLRRRQYDDLFDGRSSLGQELNQQIEQAAKYKGKADAEAAAITGPLQHRRTIWASRLAHRFAARWGVGIWYLTAQLIWHIKPDWHRPTAFAIASVVAMIATYILIEAKRETLLEEIANTPDYESSETAITPMIAR